MSAFGGEADATEALAAQVTQLPHALLTGRFDRPPLAVRRIFLARQGEFGSHAPVYQFGEAATKLSIKDVFDAVRALAH